MNTDSSVTSIQSKRLDRYCKELDFVLEEWKEARGSIARFDHMSIDLRKYGFSLITFLITGYSLVFQITNLNNPLPVVIAPFAIMILVCGLFLADRYNEVLLLSSVLRGRQLEDMSHDILKNYVQSTVYLRMNLTTFLEDRVQKVKARPFSLIIYFLFIIACLLLGMSFLLAYYQQANLSLSPMYILVLIVQGTIALAFLFIVNGKMADLISSILDEIVIDDRIVIKRIFTEERVNQSIRELARQIHRHYVNEDFVILTIGIGGLHFAQSLIGELKKLGRSNVQSIALFAERVRVDQSNYRIAIKPPEKHLLANQHVLIVDDLVSTGYTLQEAIRICQDSEVKTVHSCILLDAPAKRKAESAPIYFRGLVTPERGNFVGCGMDLESEGRDLPFIGIAKSYSPPRIHS